MDLLSLVNQPSLLAALPELEKHAEEVRAGRATKTALELPASFQEGLQAARAYGTQALGKVKNWWNTNPYQDAIRNTAIGAAGGAALGGLGSLALGPRGRKRPFSGALLGGLLGGAAGGGYSLLPRLRESLARPPLNEQARQLTNDVPRNLGRVEDQLILSNPYNLIARPMAALNAAGQDRWSDAGRNLLPDIGASTDTPGAIGAHAGLLAGTTGAQMANRARVGYRDSTAAVRNAAPANSPIRNMSDWQVFRNTRLPGNPNTVLAPGTPAVGRTPAVLDVTRRNLRDLAKTVPAAPGRGWTRTIAPHLLPQYLLNQYLSAQRLQGAGATPELAQEIQAIRDQVGGINLNTPNALPAAELSNSVNSLQTHDDRLNQILRQLGR